MRLDRLPKSMVVLGGGYIAAEMSHIFGSLGTRVTIVTRGEHLLSHHDRDIRARFTELYRERFDVRLDAAVAGLTAVPGIWALGDLANHFQLKHMANAETRLVRYNLLGAHIIGPQASTLIQPLIQAMCLGSTADQIASGVLYIHPALTDVIEQALARLIRATPGRPRSSQPLAAGHPGCVAATAAAPRRPS